MIKYENLIQIASVIAESEDIVKDGLTLVYALDAKNHEKLDEDLFYRTKRHEKGYDFSHREIIEVTIGNVNFKFIKKDISDF